MEREHHELQFLGIFGIFKEPIKLIFSGRKVFSQIALALILPLSFIVLAYLQISQLFFLHILHDQHSLVQTPKNNSKYADLSDLISLERTAFRLFKAISFSFLLFLSLLSTSAITYTIASLYAAQEITYKKVMRAVPKFWRRFKVTFVWGYAIIVLYGIVAGAVLLFFCSFIIAERVIGIVITAVVLADDHHSVPDFEKYVPLNTRDLQAVGEPHHDHV